MNKIASYLVFFLFGSIALTMFSCQKDLPLNTTGQTAESLSVLSKGPVTRAYRDSFDIDLRFIPDIPGGYVSGSAPVYFPGTGHGNATHMGNVDVYFNTHTIRNTEGVVMVNSRPVTQFYATEVEQLGLPANSDAGMVIYDGKGNTIWAKIVDQGIPSWHTDPTHIAMGGTVQIIGGTGKFSGATGETTFYAQFNQLNLKDASMWEQGWIRY